jgi:hypothetical protein
MVFAGVCCLQALDGELPVNGLRPLIPVSELNHSHEIKYAVTCINGPGISQPGPQARVPTQTEARGGRA